MQICYVDERTRSRACQSVVRAPLPAYNVYEPRSRHPHHTGSAALVRADAGAHSPDTDWSIWRDAVEALGTLFLFVFAYTFLSGILVGILVEALA